MFGFVAGIKRRKRGLAVLTVILLAGCVILYWYSRPSLSEFVNQDLRKLDDKPQLALGKMLHEFLPEQFPGPRTRLKRVLERTLPKDSTTEKKFRGFEPWYLWTHKAGSGSRFILFEVNSPRACILFLDSNGKYEGNSVYCAPKTGPQNGFS